MFLFGDRSLVKTLIAREKITRSIQYIKMWQWQFRCRCMQCAKLRKGRRINVVQRPKATTVSFWMRKYQNIIDVAVNYVCIVYISLSLMLMSDYNLCSQFFFRNFFQIRKTSVNWTWPVHIRVFVQLKSLESIKTAVEFSNTVFSNFHFQNC